MSEGGILSIVVAILLSTFRVSVPLVFASMGGILSERAGVVNIALEGLMLVGAFAAATAAALTHSPWTGAVVGMAAGMVLAAIYALFVIHARSDQIVAGTAINLFAFGITPLLAKAFFDTGGSTPALEIHDRFANQPLYLAAVTVIAIAFWFRNSRLGLWLGFAGEHPEALSTAGISVRGVRWFGVVAAGALAGLGGATLSIFLSSSFARGMTAGRGFMALAALIFGKWRPIPTLLTCLFFGLTDAVQIRLQGVPVFGDSPIPVQFIQILPYVFTVLVLAGFMGKSRPPRALGAPWLGMLAPWIILPAFFFIQGCELPSSLSRILPERFSHPTAERPLTQAENSTRGNAELLAEMVRVSLMRDPRDPKLFSDYVQSVDQGASFEGILNGWLHSDDYRKYETQSPPATPAARAFFLDEFKRLQKIVPVRMTADSGKPLPRSGIPTGSTGEASQVSTAYETIFASSSVPILKRVLFDVLLARIEAGFKDPAVTGLEDWYASTAARLGEKGIDFGLPLRNEKDAAFHRKWFEEIEKTSSSRARDLVLWESANRYFRILNQLQASPAK